MVEELIGVRLWRDKVFSLLMEDGAKREKPKSTFPCYIVVSRNPYYVQCVLIFLPYMHTWTVQMVCRNHSFSNKNSPEKS